VFMWDKMLHALIYGRQYSGGTWYHCPIEW
jgi:hypothetical protein